MGRDLRWPNDDEAAPLRARVAELEQECDDLWRKAHKCDCGDTLLPGGRCKDCVELREIYVFQLQALIRERLPENGAAIPIEDINDHYEDWYTRARELLGDNGDG
jgi:hypothetical protein